MRQSSAPPFPCTPHCLRRPLLRHVPGFPAFLGASPLLDTACTFTAACDVAIADAGFRGATDSSNLAMVASLSVMYLRAAAEFPKSPEAAALLALMDFQYGRLQASRVRTAVSCRRVIAHGPCIACGLQQRARPSLHALAEGWCGS